MLRTVLKYLSPDLRAHAVAFFIAPVLMQHDRNRFEVFAYYNYPEKDQFTNNLRPCCHQWRDIAGLPDEAVASLIREDGYITFASLNNFPRSMRASSISGSDC